MTCRDDHVTKSWNRKLIRVTSSANVWSINASISVTVTDIWTKFGTEHKYRTINTQEWPNSHKLKIQDCGGRHLEFRKNVNNFGLDKDMLHQIIGEDAPWRRRDDHIIKSRNRKLETDRKWLLSYGQSRKVVESMQTAFGRNRNKAES